VWTMVHLSEEHGGGTCFFFRVNECWFESWVTSWTQGWYAQH
jgi:hypothetical protein